MRHAEDRFDISGNGRHLYPSGDPLSTRADNNLAENILDEQLDSFDWLSVQGAAGGASVVPILMAQYRQRK